MLAFGAIVAAGALALTGCSSSVSSGQSSAGGVTSLDWVIWGNTPPEIASSALAISGGVLPQITQSKLVTPPALDCPLDTLELHPVSASAPAATIAPKASILFFTFPPG